MKFDNELLQVLCPFGEWNHSKGMQVVDKESARRMKCSASWSPISRIPVYIGHPDENPSKRKPQAVGRIKRICQTHDGIAVVVMYSKDTYKNVINGKYTAMSPRWQMERIDGEKFRPVKLISVGLTNNPNIPDSGKILSMKKDFDLLKNTIGETKKISQQIKKIGIQLSKMSDNTEKLKRELDTERISKRLKQRKSEKQSEGIAGRKVSVKKLVELARTRSKTLGEPYTKSFAVVKKQNI